GRVQGTSTSSPRARASRRSFTRAKPQLKAKRRAPTWEASARAWRGVGSRAKRYACNTRTGKPPRSSKDIVPEHLFSDNEPAEQGRGCEDLMISEEKR